MLYLHSPRLCRAGAVFRAGDKGLCSFYHRGVSCSELETLRTVQKSISLTLDTAHLQLCSYVKITECEIQKGCLVIETSSFCLFVLLNFETSKKKIDEELLENTHREKSCTSGGRITEHLQWEEPLKCIHPNFLPSTARSPAPKNEIHSCLNSSRDGHSTSALSSLFQCLIKHSAGRKSLCLLALKHNILVKHKMRQQVWVRSTRTKLGSISWWAGLLRHLRAKNTLLTADLVACRTKAALAQVGDKLLAL